MTDESNTPASSELTKKTSAKRVRKPAAPAKPAAKTAHRADAAQAFMASWLSKHPVSADAFTADDADALIAAIDAAAKH